MAWEDVDDDGLARPQWTVALLVGIAGLAAAGGDRVPPNAVALDQGYVDQTL